MYSLPGSRTLRTYTPREIKWALEGILYSPRMTVLDADYAYDGANTGYPYELRAGLLVGKITSSGLFRGCTRTQANGGGDASQALVVDDARTIKAGDVLVLGGNQKFSIGRVKDDDNAASVGLALYLHIDELGENDFGHLESVTAGNADSTFQIGASGAVVRVEDDDAAATGGVAIYFDEDAANPDERFLANVGTGRDAFIMATDGRAIRIKYHATPSSVGVQVYFDDDAANAHERVRFVSPTNTEGVYHTDDIRGVQTEVTRSSSCTVSSVDYTTNTVTISAAKTWADGDTVYANDGSDNPVGILDELVNLLDSDATARDKVTGKLLVRGPVKASMVLGDLAAIRAQLPNCAFLKDIKFDDEV